MVPNKKKGFSMIELLVAMAIIAILLALVIFGVQLVQRNSRDTIRRNAVRDLGLAYTDITGNSTDVPSKLSKSGNNIQFQDSSNTALGEAVPVRTLTPEVVTTKPSAKETSKTTANFYFNSSARELCAAIEASAIPFCLSL